MVSAAMPNTTIDTPLRRIEPSARARCSCRSVPAAATAAADRAAVSSAADGTGGPGARRLRMAGRMAATGSVVVAARSVILLITRFATARTTSATTITNKIRSPWLTGPARYTRTSWAALVLWVTSQARRQAMPGLSPQLPVSVPEPGPVAKNTELPP